MKNPRISLHRVPGHRKVGADIARIINEYLDEFPDVQLRIHPAIGDTAKRNKRGPRKSRFRDLRSGLQITLYSFRKIECAAA